MPNISWLSQSSYIKGNKEVFLAVVEEVKKDYVDAEVVTWYEDKMKIEMVRQIMDSLNSKPLNEKRFTILGFNTIGLDAQNAMLKTLEEPSSDTSIIFVTALPEKLIQTVRSRMVERKFEFKSKTNPPAGGKKSAGNISEALKQVEKILKEVKKGEGNESAKIFVTNLMTEQKDIKTKAMLLKLYSYLDDSSASTKHILETAVILSF